MFFWRWQIVLLAFSYLIFFSSTIWRSLKYGEFSDRSQDEQTKSLLGRLALVIAILGFGSTHWLAIYDFSRLQSLENNLINYTLNTIAILLIIIAIVLNQVAVRSLGRFFDRLVIKSEHKLLTTGIYSYIQHPIYTSYIVLFGSFCLLLHSLLSIGLLAVVCLVWFSNRISIEEKMLSQQFGNEYQAYQQKTKKLFPFVY